MSRDGDGYSHLQQKPEHKMILTMPKNGNRIYRVRCKCMAEYRNVSDRYFNYDWLAEVPDADEAIRVYREHLAAPARPALAHLG